MAVRAPESPNDRFVVACPETRITAIIGPFVTIGNFHQQVDEVSDQPWKDWQDGKSARGLSDVSIRLEPTLRGIVEGGFAPGSAESVQDARR